MKFLKNLQAAKEAKKAKERKELKWIGITLVVIMSFTLVTALLEDNENSNDYNDYNDYDSYYAETTNEPATEDEEIAILPEFEESELLTEEVSALYEIYEFESEPELAPPSSASESISAPPPLPPTTQVAERTVYITQTGARYHSTRNCRGLNRARHVSPVTITQGRRGRSSACQICW